MVMIRDEQESSLRVNHIITSTATSEREKEREVQAVKDVSHFILPAEITSYI